MIDPSGPLIAAASAVTAFVGNGILLAASVGFVLLAWRQGFFLATLVGLGVLLSFIVALASVPAVGRMLVEAEVPARHAPCIAYLLTLGVTFLAVRLVIGQVLPEQAVWNGTLLGRLTGITVGLLAGSIFTGSLLVGWSLAALPPALMLQQRDLAFDAGSMMVKVFARFVEPDRRRRDALLGGSSRFAGESAAGRPPCSEPFVDANQNCIRDDDERFLDIDGDKAFSPVLAGVDGGSATERWTPGLLDCYLMSAWQDVKALHAPALESAAVAQVEAAVLGDGLYQAVASDPDPGDQLTYGLEPGEASSAPGLVIDVATGKVMLSEAAALEPRTEYLFTVTATDRAGLSAKRAVKVTIRNLPPATP